MKISVILGVFVAIFALSEAARTIPPRAEGRTPQYLRTRERSGRIFGGSPADIADFPHMLVLLDLTAGGFICGASVISPLWSLSAAHCLEFDVPASMINLRGGSTDRTRGGYLFFAEFYVLHPEYDTFWLDFDVAIIRVQNDTPMQGIHVQPVPISPPCQASCCQTCEHATNHVTITGWGLTEQNIFPENLVQITKPIENHARCNELWQGIGDWFVCIVAEPGRDSCNGDSGSPLVRNIDGQRHQIALVSFGTTTCGTGAAPSVNSRLEYPPIRNWITEISGV